MRGTGIRILAAIAWYTRCGTASGAPPLRPDSDVLASLFLKKCKEGHSIPLSIKEGSCFRSGAGVFSCSYESRTAVSRRFQLCRADAGEHRHFTSFTSSCPSAIEDFLHEPIQATLGTLPKYDRWSILACCISHNANSWTHINEGRPHVMDHIRIHINSVVPGPPHSPFCAEDAQLGHFWSVNGRPNFKGSPASAQIVGR